METPITYRILINQRKTHITRPDLFGLYAWLGLIRVSHRDSHLARLHPRLRAAVADDGQELRFRVKEVDRIQRHSARSLLAALAFLGRPRVPSEDIAFFRFENFPNLTDDPNEIEMAYEKAIAK
ncbi:MAG TPA: hypothetical protein VLZ81_08375 [Blastocatellia bacterium]|nr:hypothetical protein [Blastocatellia bacterium]